MMIPNFRLFGPRPTKTTTTPKLRGAALIGKGHRFEYTGTGVRLHYDLTPDQQDELDNAIKVLQGKCRLAINKANQEYESDLRLLLLKTAPPLEPVLELTQTQEEPGYAE